MFNKKKTVEPVINTFQMFYKCKLCGETFNRERKTQSTKEHCWNSPIYKQHNCNDGGLGVAELIGIK